MASIQGIYLAFFGRPADPLGLAYWEEQTNDGADLSVMLDALSGTEEYQDRFVGMSNEEVIQSIYQALFGRDAEPDGLAHFLEALENGTQTLGSIAVNILDGAQGSDLAMIENKVAAADIFTASLDTPEEIEAYSGNEAAEFGRQFLSTVTDDPETVPTAEAVQEQIDADMPNYEPDEGQAPGGGGGGGGGPTPPTPAEIIMAEWRALDDQYADGGTIELNKAFTQLGVKYIEYLNDGGAPILDRAKGDGTARDQSFHDNLLGNVTESALQQRYGSEGTELRDEMQALVEEADGRFLDRPYADGQPPVKFSTADAWDILNDVNRPDLVTKLHEAEFTAADEALDGKYEPNINIDSLIADFASDGLLSEDEFGALVGVAGAENAFRFLWDYIDDNYSYYDETINSFGVDAGIQYALYLKESGNSPILDIVKFIEGSREQSMHDNLLGNLHEYSIVDKFGLDAGENDITASEIIARIETAGLEDILGTVGLYNTGGTTNDPDERPFYGGYASEDSTATREWDADFFGWNLA